MPATCPALAAAAAAAVLAACFSGGQLLHVPVAAAAFVMRTRTSRTTAPHTPYASGTCGPTLCVNRAGAGRSARITCASTRSSCLLLGGADGDSDVGACNANDGVDIPRRSFLASGCPHQHHRGRCMHVHGSRPCVGRRRCRWQRHWHRTGSNVRLPVRRAPLPSTSWPWSPPEV